MVESSSWVMHKTQLWSLMNYFTLITSSWSTDIIVTEYLEKASLYSVKLEYGRQRNSIYSLGPSQIRLFGKYWVDSAALLGLNMTPSLRPSPPSPGLPGTAQREARGTWCDIEFEPLGCSFSAWPRQLFIFYICVPSAADGDARTTPGIRGWGGVGDDRSSLPWRRHAEKNNV